MLETKTKYICEQCYNQYNKKEDAQKCEDIGSPLEDLEDVGSIKDLKNGANITYYPQNRFRHPETEKGTMIAKFIKRKKDTHIWCLLITTKFGIRVVEIDKDGAATLTDLN